MSIHGQSDQQAVADAILQPVSPDAVPTSGTFYLLSGYLNNEGSLSAPYPFLPTNGTVYALNNANTIFLVDDTGMSNDQEVLNALALLLQPQDTFSAGVLNGTTFTSGTMMTMDAADLNPADGGTNSGGGGSYSPDFEESYPTNALWVDVPTNSLAVPGEFEVVLENTISNEEYDLLTSTNLALPLSNWVVEQSVGGVEGTNCTPVTLMMNGRSNLFVYARFGGSSDGSGLPDWWEFEYFGTNYINPYAPDSSGDGWDLIDDFQNGWVPGTWNTPPPPQNFSVTGDSTGTNVVCTWQSGGGPVDHYEIDEGGDSESFEAGEVNNGTFTFSNNVSLELLGSEPYQVVAVFPNGDRSSTAWELPALYRSATVFRGAGGQYFLALPNVPQNLAEVDFITTLSPLVAEQVDASNVVDGIVQIPQDLQTLGFGLVQLVDSSGNSSGYIAPTFATLPEAEWEWAPVTPVTNFANASVQMKENLKFLLRAAGVVWPFGYSSGLYFEAPQYPQYQQNDPQADYDASQPENCLARGTASTNYEYYGFHTFSPDLNFSFVDELRPVRENFLWRNFIYSPIDYTNGGFDTGFGWDLGIDNLGFYSDWPTVFDAKYQYTGTGTENPLPLAFDSSDSGWIFHPPIDGTLGVYPSQTNAYEDVLGTGLANIYGLDLQSAYSDTNFVSPGSIFPDNGDFYPFENFAEPNLQIVDYYFNSQTPFFNFVDTNAAGGNPSSYTGSPPAIPGSPAFSTTNTSPLLITGVGQPITVSGWAKMAISNGATNKFGYLEQYFDFGQAYVIDTNGLVTTNSAGMLSPYGDFFPTVPGPAALITMPDIDSGQRGTSVVNVIKLQLDVNHDGVMDLSYGGPDNTSAANPFVFWLNNDFDRYFVWADGSVDPDDDWMTNAGKMLYRPEWERVPDSEYRDPELAWPSGIRVIPSVRDLEDFARLWVCGGTSNFLTSLPAGTVIELSWGDTGNPNTNNPTIDLFNAADADISSAPYGSEGYLTNTYSAMLQTNNSLYAGRLGPGSNIVAPATNFLNTQALIWCGVKKGSGKLTLDFKQGSNTLAETSAYVQIKDIKEMYERWTVGDNPNLAPVNVPYLAHNELPVGTPPFQYAASGDTNTPYILLVQDYDLPTWKQDAYAETAFKRLYWQGYQGRFGEFRWPGSNSMSIHLLDDSEFNAWRSAAGLLNLLTNLNDQYPGNVYLMAHGYGAIAAGEALRLAGTNTIVNTYIAMQGAVAAQAYDPSLPSRTLPPGTANTPNRYLWYFTNGAPPYFSGVGGAATYINCFDTNDFVLTNLWRDTQNTKPDIGYSWDGTNFWVGLPPLQLGLLLFPVDRYRIFSYCDQARCEAIGAQPNLGGPFFGQPSIDLSATLPFVISDHFEQFGTTCADTWPFWSEVMGTNGFGLKP